MLNRRSSDENLNTKKKSACSPDAKRDEAQRFLNLNFHSEFLVQTRIWRVKFSVVARGDLRTKFSSSGWIF